MDNIYHLGILLYSSYLIYCKILIFLGKCYMYSISTVGQLKHICEVMY